VAVAEAEVDALEAEVDALDAPLDTAVDAELELQVVCR
jgi:hypothetical protein